MRVSENPTTGMSPHLFRQGRVGIGILTTGPLAAFAKITVAARDRKRNDHSIARLQIFDAFADLDDFAHELMPEDISFLHRRNVSVVKVKIRSADRGR